MPNGWRTAIVDSCDQLSYSKRNQGRILDKEYKRELAALLYEDCTLGGKQMDLQTALEYYILSVLQAMADEKAPMMKEVGFHSAA